MLRFADFYANRRQMTDKPIALPPAAHARTRDNNKARHNKIQIATVQGRRQGGFEGVRSNPPFDSLLSIHINSYHLL